MAPPSTTKQIGRKLKIAVLLAGNLRTFEQTAPNLKKYLLDKYDSDVFIYTPNQMEHNSIAHHGFTGNGGPPPSPITPAIVKKIKQLYHPKKLVVSDDYKKIHAAGLWRYPRPIHHGRPNGTPVVGCYRMFFNWEQVNRLWQGYAKQKKITYDYVLFTRPDVLLLEGVDLEPYKKFFDFNPNTIMFNYGQGEIDENNHTKLFYYFNSDRIIFAKPDAMRIFLNIFHHFDRYFLAHKLPLPGWARASFEQQQIFYAIEQGLFPLFSKISYVLKRANNQDQVFIFPDHFGYSSAAIPRPFLAIVRREINAKAKVIKIMVQYLFYAPALNRLWFFCKWLKGVIKNNGEEQPV